MRPRVFTWLDSSGIRRCDKTVRSGMLRVRTIVSMDGLETEEIIDERYGDELARDLEGDVDDE